MKTELNYAFNCHKIQKIPYDLRNWRFIKSSRYRFYILNAQDALRAALSIITSISATVWYINLPATWLYIGAAITYTLYPIHLCIVCHVPRSYSNRRVASGPHWGCAFWTCWYQARLCRGQKACSVCRCSRSCCAAPTSAANRSRNLADHSPRDPSNSPDASRCPLFSSCRRFAYQRRVLKRDFITPRRAIACRYSLGKLSALPNVHV